MSRLLHAAARGARIGWQTLSGKWHPAVSLIDVQSEGGQVAYRIHPNDAHLQYGPISTALREMAKSAKANVYVFPHFPSYFGFGVEHQTQAEADSARASDELTHSLFFLILAQVFADEGM